MSTGPPSYSVAMLPGSYWLPWQPDGSRQFKEGDVWAGVGAGVGVGGGAGAGWRTCILPLISQRKWLDVFPLLQVPSTGRIIKYIMRGDKQTLHNSLHCFLPALQSSCPPHPPYYGMLFDIGSISFTLVTPRCIAAKSNRDK